MVWYSLSDSAVLSHAEYGEMDKIGFSYVFRRLFSASVSPWAGP